MNKNWIIISVILIGILFSITFTITSAQDINKDNINKDNINKDIANSAMIYSTELKYSVQFRCDMTGYQQTFIDIHNPQTVPITINRTIVLATTIDQPTNSPVQLPPYEIRPGEATEINCQTMWRMGELNNTNPSFGFTTIKSAQPLNIVVNYATTPSSFWATWNTEIISPLSYYSPKLQ